MLLSILLCIIASHVYASHAGEQVSVSGLMFRTLLKAAKTNVLEMHQCFGVDWLEFYDPSLTERSVGEFESFLRKCVAYDGLNPNEALVVNANDPMVPCADSPLERAAAGSQSELVKMIHKALVAYSFPVEKTLMKYTVCKIFLHGRLGQTMSKILKIMFSVDIPDPELIELSQFTDKLSEVQSHGELFAALAVGWNSEAVSAAWDGLRAPEVVAKLVDAYVREYNERCVEIPYGLFYRLNPECQYRLARTCNLDPYRNIIDWRAFYFLSKLPDDPSEEIRIVCLKQDDKLLRYESEESPTDLKTLAEDVNDSEELSKILDLRSYPWMYMFKSRWDVFRHILSLDLQLQDAAMFGRKMGWAWTNTIGREISETRPLMTLKEYSDLYVRCCRAAGSHYLESTGMCSSKVACNPALVLHQWFEMSEEDYAKVVKIIVEEHKMTPMIPLEYWTNNSGKLMHVLEEFGDLVNQLLEKGDCDSLLSELFLRRVHIPPKVAAVFETKTALYRLLFWKDGGIRGYLSEMFKIYSRPLPNWTLPSIVIKSCMLLKPNDGPEVLELLRKEIRRCFWIGNTELLGLPPAMLTVSIIKSLFRCRNLYSEEELGVIEQGLEKCGLWDDGDMPVVFLECVSEFFQDPLLTFELVD